MSVLFEINRELAKLYHNLRCPREVRAYCRETVILAQKLVLPLQCASYLVYLAHADLRSTRYEDCQVKLDGLADILCLTKHGVQQIEQELKPPAPVCYEKEVEGIANEMREMVLDLPASKHFKRQLSPASPTFAIQPFHLPGVLSHGASCDCFCCVCVEYQELVLEKTRLEALINVKYGNHVVAEDFFRGALDLYERYTGRYESYAESVSDFLSYDLIPEFEKELLSAYGYVLLSYSYHLMRGKNKADALKTTDKLIGVVVPRKVELVYLYNEVLVQKLGYLTDGPPPVPDTAIARDLDVICPEEPVDLPTTPKLKLNAVTIPSHYSPAFSPPKRVVKKCLKFNLSPNDVDAENKRTKAKRAPKTPAPKLQIYSNDDLVLKAKSPAPKVQIFTETKKPGRRKRLASINDAFLAPAGAEAPGTPTVAVPARNESALKSKTKQLTERLRQSSRKLEGTDNGAVQSERKKTSARKNLLGELASSESEERVGQGAIRKSSRRKKL